MGLWTISKVVPKPKPDATPPPATATATEAPTSSPPKRRRRLPQDYAESDGTLVWKGRMHQAKKLI